MVAHIVMMRPKAALTAPARETLLDAMRTAFTGIAEIKRVRVGKRLVIGRGYEAQMAQHFEYAAVVEFDSEADLRTYLDHPAHAELGRLFFELAEAALVYDFVTVGPEEIRLLA